MYISTMAYYLYWLLYTINLIDEHTNDTNYYIVKILCDQMIANESEV